MSVSEEGRERISQEDLARHQRMVAYMQKAEAHMVEAEALAARARDLRAAFVIWAEELHERYEIPRDGGVDEAGFIVRPDPPASG